MSSNPASERPNGWQPFNALRDEVCKHADHGEFEHPGSGRYGCIDEIMLAIDRIEKADEPREAVPCPVSAQRVRWIADDFAIETAAFKDLRALADWLEEREKR